MPENKKPSAPPGETPLHSLPEAVPVERLSLSLKNLLRTLPEHEWNQIRAFRVESDEEGQLLEMVPRVNRAMKICPGQVIRRLNMKKITAQEIDEAYNRLHDALHGVRQALQELFKLAEIPCGRPGDQQNGQPKAAPVGKSPAGGKASGPLPDPSQGGPQKAASETLAVPAG